MRSIARHRLRSALTAVGLVIGVAAVINAVSIGRGAAVSVKERMNALGSNFIVIIPEQITVQGARVEAQRSKLTI